MDIQISPFYFLLAIFIGFMVIYITTKPDIVVKQKRNGCIGEECKMDEK